MGRKKTYRLCGEYFTTQQELIERIKAILWSYEVGDMVSRDDARFLAALLHSHPYGDQKIGIGIASIEVRVNPEYPSTRGFYINRYDGTGTDFSYQKCLRKPTHRQKVLRAMRYEIAPQIITFKRAEFDRGDVFCPYTGDKVTWDNAHVDHESPMTFEKLAESYVELIIGTFEMVSIVGDGEDNSYAYRLDRQVADSWMDYHRTHAKLRILSTTANLSHAKVGALQVKSLPSMQFRLLT